MVSQNDDRRVFFWLLLAFFFLLQPHVANSDEQNAKRTNSPRITIDQNAYDFGTVDRGVWLKHKFTLTNTGDAPLTLSRTYATCGCTVPKLTKNKLAPGETGDL